MRGINEGAEDTSQASRHQRQTTSRVAYRPGWRNSGPPEESPTAAALPIEAVGMDGSVSFDGETITVRRSQSFTADDQTDEAQLDVHRLLTMRWRPATATIRGILHVSLLPPPPPNAQFVNDGFGFSEGGHTVVFKLRQSDQFAALVAAIEAARRAARVAAGPTYPLRPADTPGATFADSVVDRHDQARGAG